MAIVNITTGAKLVDLTRQTLYAHKKKGKVSFTRMPDGSNGIDTAELQRVYGKLRVTPEQLDRMSSDSVSVKSDTSLHSTTAKTDSIDKGLQAEITRITELLEKEKTERRQDRDDFTDQINDLRKQRDDWSHQAKSAMLRLEHLEVVDLGEPAKPKRRFFGLLAPKEVA